MTTGTSRSDADPRTAIRIMATAAATNPHDLPVELVARGGSIIDWARSVEASFGKAVDTGIAVIASHCRPETIHGYLDRVTEAGHHGPALGKLMAELLVPVMRRCDNGDVTVRFMATVTVMRQKGTYTLNHGLGPVGPMLDAGDIAATDAYLKMAAHLFGLPLTYNRCLFLSEAIPRAVMQMPEDRRLPLILGLHRLLVVDPGLIDPYLDGLGKGLALLDAEAIAGFVDAGIRAHAVSSRKAHRHLALISQSGRDQWHRTRRAVAFTSVQAGLRGYARARLGQPVALRPLTDLPDHVVSPAGLSRPLVASDDQTLYLTDRLERYPSQDENKRMFSCLVRLETGLLECNTYSFDLEQADMACGTWSPQYPIAPQHGLSDMERFFQRFPAPQLAWDLFTILEHSRVARQLAIAYPGLARQTHPMIIDALTPNDRAEQRLALVYCRLMRIAPPAGLSPIAMDRAWLARLDTCADEILVPGSPVEATAKLLTALHDDMADRLTPATGADRLRLPFGRRVRPDLAFRTDSALDRLAAAVTARYRKAGIGLFKSNVRAALAGAHPDTVKSMQFRPDPEHPLSQRAAPRPAAPVAIDDLIVDRPATAPPSTSSTGMAFWYPEWDARIGDRLEAHCRVVVQPAREGSPASYQATVNRHDRLIAEIRQAFERIRPEGMGLLRQWVDGDDFDYRALVDHAVDLHSGRTPSERLYIKRVKQHRDIAVLLLVDLSRSTAAPAGTDPNETVLGIAKSAIILLCEALDALGDTYALAGFSGHGRLDVRYWPIKSPEEPLSQTVQGRIGAIMPHRSTRMGAAIRHATAELTQMPAAVRLLLVLGDGFPNDIDYKKDYAIEDTQRAIGEARALHIFTHGITVNVAADPQLDRLFGPTHHSVISDVTELPERLWRIYRALTT